VDGFEGVAFLADKTEFEFFQGSGSGASRLLKRAVVIVFFFASNINGGTCAGPSGEKKAALAGDGEEG